VLHRLTNDPLQLGRNAVQQRALQHTGGVLFQLDGVSGVGPRDAAARRNILKRFRAEHGDKRFGMLRRAHVKSTLLLPSLTTRWNNRTKIPEKTAGRLTVCATVGHGISERKNEMFGNIRLTNIPV
jgi:hypothetical protein